MKQCIPFYFLCMVSGGEKQLCCVRCPWVCLVILVLYKVSSGLYSGKKTKNWGIKGAQELAWNAGPHGFALGSLVSSYIPKHTSRWICSMDMLYYNNRCECTRFPVMDVPSRVSSRFMPSIPGMGSGFTATLIRIMQLLNDILMNV